MTVKKLLSTRNYRAGYILRKELIDGAEFSGPDFEVTSAYTPDGLYIGDSKTAYYLCKKKGIKPELRNGCSVCSIGFCEREQKWYGWSHRAIFGFRVGDTVKSGDCTNSSGFDEEYLVDHPEADYSLPLGFVAKNLSDAKRMAVAFADSVS